VVVDRQGIVRLYHPGRMTQEELEQQLRAAPCFVDRRGETLKTLILVPSLRRLMIMRTMSSALALLVFVTLPALAQQPPQKIDLTRLGPQVGQVVPDFRLQDATGNVWTRESIMGPKGAMLVFSRSADW
jgi:hypothetical protein